MTTHQFTALIQPLFETAYEARAEKGIEPAAMGLAMIGAGKDVVLAECGPALAAGALLAALDALRAEYPDAVKQAAEASAGQTSTAGLQ